jgi:hypothetical protein
MGREDARDRLVVVVETEEAERPEHLFFRSQFCRPGLHTIPSKCSANRGSSVRGVEGGDDGITIRKIRVEM